MKRPAWWSREWWRRQIDPGYPRAPIETEHFPPGIPYIIGNEAAERFSFYGMRAILVTFMTTYLLDASLMHRQVMSPEEAKAVYHTFNAAVYFFPILGALLADIVLGKYWTIMLLSIVYVAGHTALAWNEARLGLFVGLTLIAIGSGGIKSCVSAHVGDQFCRKNQHWMSRIFGWFYMAINVGAAASSLATPWLLENVGPGLAFGIPGILMAIATLVFFMGRAKFAHIPPGGATFLREAFSREGIGALVRLTLIFVPVAMFWALFDQTGSSWVLQAEHMNRTLFHYTASDGTLAAFEIHPAQIQALNPILILILIPLFDWVVYPAVGRFVRVTPLRKISTGMYVAAGSFVVIAIAEHLIAANRTPSIAWQGAAYVVLTAAEVLVSVTCLEFAYTQAPRSMKSLVMGLYLLSVSLGNSFAAGVNYVIETVKAAGGHWLEGPTYWWFFVAAMTAVAAIFSAIAFRFPEKTYLQDDDTVDSEPTTAADSD